MAVLKNVENKIKLVMVCLLYTSFQCGFSKVAVRLLIFAEPSQQWHILLLDFLPLFDATVLQLSLIHICMQKTKHPILIPFGKKALEWLPDKEDKSEDSLVFNTPQICNCDRALKRMATEAYICVVLTLLCPNSLLTVTMSHPARIANVPKVCRLV